MGKIIDLFKRSLRQDQPHDPIIDELKSEIQRAAVRRAEEIRKSKLASVHYQGCLICLGATMLPIKAGMIIFSITAMCALVCYFYALRRNGEKLTLRAGSALAGIALLSTLSGCGPILFTEPVPDLFGLERQSNIKTNTITRVGIFGLGLKDATAEQAQKEAGIESLVAARIEEGYGLISMVRISVAGK